MSRTASDAAAAFADVVYADQQWVDAEFTEIIATSFGEPPPPPPPAPPRVPPLPGSLPRPPSRPLPARIGVTPVLDFLELINIGETLVLACQHHAHTDVDQLRRLQHQCRIDAADPIAKRLRHVGTPTERGQQCGRG